MSINDLIVLRGRAGTDVVLHQSESTSTGEPGRVFCRFRLAVNRAWRKDNGEWEESPPVWYTVRAWGKLAENAYFSVRRGAPVLVVGRPSAQAWIDKEGALQSELAINAVSIGFDLTFGMATFRKVTPAGGTDESEEADQEMAEESFEEEQDQDVEGGEDEGGESAAGDLEADDSKMQVASA